jgi:hypothetical protein
MTDSHRTAESVSHNMEVASHTGTGVDIAKGGGAWSAAPTAQPYSPRHMIVMDPANNTPVILPSNYQLPIPQGVAGAPQGSYTGTPATAGTVLQATPYVMMYLPAKQGHKCCGCCCDVRRATIVVSAVNLSLDVFVMMVLSSCLFGPFTTSMEVIQCSPMLTIVETILSFDSRAPVTTSMLITIFYVLFRMVAEAVSIYGAMTYSQWMVGVGLAGYVVHALLALVQVQLVAVVVACFAAYPHVALIDEMRKGIMTEQTYLFEKHSCCCV